MTVRGERQRMDGILLAIDADGERAIDRAETVAGLPTGDGRPRDAVARLRGELRDRPAGRVDGA